MSKYCYNYETSEYEYIEEDGYRTFEGGYTYNFDDSEYRREREEEEERERQEEENRRSLWDEDED